MLDITYGFVAIWESFEFFVGWLRANGISITIDGQAHTANFFTIYLAAYVITLVLSYIPPFDEGE